MYYYNYSYKVHLYFLVLLTTAAALSVSYATIVRMSRNPTSKTGVSLQNQGKYKMLECLQ
jgi:hypothetical protein